MKIEIDTKHDSPEELKKVIKMLQHLVGESPITNQPNIFEDPNSFGASSTEGTPSSGGVFGNMFDSPSSTTEETETKKEEEETPELIPY